MKEFIEEYGAIILTIIVVAGLIRGFAGVFVYVQGGGY